MWSSWHVEERADNRLTQRSIRYWAQKCNPQGYEEVRKQTLEYFIDETLREGPSTATEYDLANVLYYLFKDRFVCVGLRTKCWYEFMDNRWVEIDSATTLRLAISKDMHDVYTNKTREAINAMHTLEHSDERWVKLQKRSHKLAEICIMLKTTAKKDNIMKEAAHLFYDRQFFKSLDSNTHLLCFNNGVYDFNENCFRKGLPEDYVSKTTGINYVPFEQAKKTKEYSELNTFLSQLFPDKQLFKYQMDFMASLVVGGNENHQMCFWIGTGANGKTALVTLLEKAFGEYKGTVPVTLVTRERLNIGTASPEVAALAGVRLAVMQETSKGDKINEGPMKDLTGGDPITARALYKEPITFRPQMKLVLCTNVEPTIESQDDGTWRRIKVVDFEAKFHRKPYEDEVHFPKDRYPHQFPIDTKLFKKFDKWAPVLMSMMVERYQSTKGEVIDCDRVIASSDRYREGQDFFLDFVKENIETCEGSRIQKTALLPKFRFWFKANHGRGAPKSQELWDFMEKRFGQYKKGWNNIRFVEANEDGDELQQL
jgi:P4 family phage/plasmid primase-like protien